jgi:hypothetical protein
MDIGEPDGAQVFTLAPGCRHPFRGGCLCVVDVGYILHGPHDTTGMCLPDEAGMTVS